MNESQQKEYLQLCHAMQTGVAMSQACGCQDGTPKHLRVGVNSALVSNTAVVRLLVEKGIITDKEYADALITSMREEVKRYEHELTEKMGKSVRLY